MQTSFEYKVVTQTIYKSAVEAMNRGLADPKWTAELSQINLKDIELLRPAVILDIDETVLDNSQYQAQLIIDRSAYSHSTWDEWIAKEKAERIPGALPFIKTAHKKNVKVIYVSNRSCKKRPDSPSPCPQKENTINNLKKAGFPFDERNDAILLRNALPNWSSEKSIRRTEVSKKYRIILMLGDDLGDFIPSVTSSKSDTLRNTIASKYHDYWGEKWFVLPNPSYGSWLRALNHNNKIDLAGYN